MAPTAQQLAGQWHSHLLQPTALPRLASRAADNTAPVVLYFTPHEKYIQRCVAMTSASISILSACVVLYWFIKMRRNFRHHLIMILIVSDASKSVWYLIFPAVVFFQGTVKDSSSFCQATGFFVALGIQATDFATILIAVHAALYVFRSSTVLSGGGLYRHRYMAYFCWVAFSLITASLAFLNHSNPFVSQGTFCYLPVRPFWYRLALAWVPRYIIFVIILGTYIAIYTYVKYKFKGVQVTLGGSDLSPQTSRSSPDDEDDDDDDQSPRAESLLEKRVTPSTPDLDAHGLTEESGTTSSPASADPSNPSTSITPQGNSRCGEVPSPAHPVWENYTFGASAALAPLPPGESPRLEGPGSQIDSETDEASTRQLSGKERRPSAPSLGSRRIVNLVQVLRENRRVSYYAPGSDPQSPSKGDRPIRLIGSDGSDLITRSLRRQQIAIRRQLRYMFIYPAVYMLLWIAPFVGHCFNYSNHYSRYPIFWINTCVVIIIPLQCAVDCWLFAYREKPWQYIPGSRGTFWNSFAYWTHDHRGEAGRVGSHGPRRRSGGRRVELRLAYRRREEEMAKLKALKMSESEDRRSKHGSLARDRRGGDRTWWEEEGKRRQDSVWLGTQSVSEPEGGGRIPTIDEEHQDSGRYSGTTDGERRVGHTTT